MRITNIVSTVMLKVCYEILNLVHSTSILILVIFIQVQDGLRGISVSSCVYAAQEFIGI